MLIANDRAFELEIDPFSGPKLQVVRRIVGLSPKIRFPS
jgi:hypothetical protein